MRNILPLAAISLLLWGLGLACGDEDQEPTPDQGATDLGGDRDTSADPASTDAEVGPDQVVTDAIEDTGPTGPPVTIQVGDVFSTGTALRDAYGGATGVVAEDGTITLATHANGVLLLERDEEPGVESAFSWDNATVYFVITDRFANGDTSNDTSYGRYPDGDQEVGTFHGGDLVGLTAKLDYLQQLGVNAIWISPPYEQVHGYIGGGTNGTFQHWAYHGYWALDFTRLDANMGTEEDLEDFVNAAHARGIRVVFDVVMNHPGYGTLADLAVYLPEVLDGEYEGWTPTEGENWHSWNTLFVDYQSNQWSNWWGPSWIRATFPDHQPYGTDDLTRHLSYLPDFRTESTEVLTALPVLLQRKTDTAAEVIEGATVREYLISWLTGWVRDFGIDGFRCDTAKHVELPAWAALKQEADQALDDWKEDNPELALDDLDFWMTGEVFPHGVVRDLYFPQGGFDSLINFDFQTAVRQALQDHGQLETLYSTYAEAINTDPTFNVLSYISSHDTHLYFSQNGANLANQYKVGTALLMLPGGVQIFYGDETARPAGPNGGEAGQETRSDMNWDSYDAQLLAHWQRLGTFRNRHVAVGAGSHRQLTFEGGYAFAREYSEGEIDDKVVVVILD
ncbi:MAG: alpha-amylase [Bradymonadales bacterium]|nr:alpha-amylase [Bradymonadales bacterium]